MKVGRTKKRTSLIVPGETGQEPIVWFWANNPSVMNFAAMELDAHAVRELAERLKAWLASGDF